MTTTDDNQPITPEWCLANGATPRVAHYVFDDPLRVAVRPIGKGDAWLVMVNSAMLVWSPTTTGLIELLRKALRGEE